MALTYFSPIQSWQLLCTSSQYLTRMLGIQWLTNLIQLWTNTFQSTSKGTYIYARGPLHTRDWEPVTIKLQALSLVENAEPVQVRFTVRLRDQQSMWMQYGCKVHMDSYMASNGSCFMVTWTVFKNHLLEVRLTQNRETTTLQTFISIGLFYFFLSCVRTCKSRN